MRIALISDTHMPRGERRVPDFCVEAMLDSDLIIHAGDLSSIAVLDWLETLGPPVYAVHGNVDSPEVRERLPERLEVGLSEGLSLGVIHDAGPAKGRLARMRRAFPGADAVVFGHSHIPLHEELNGFQIFNPGSPTERRRSPRHSFGLAETGIGGLAMRHVWL
jgi:putative phosphoesterase